MLEAMKLWICTLILLVVRVDGRKGYDLGVKMPNHTLSHFELGWGARQPFILLMYQQSTFNVEYTLFCNHSDDQYRIEVVSKRQVVFTVRETKKTNISCKSATDLLVNVTEGPDVTASDSVAAKYHVMHRKGVRGNFTFNLYGELIGRAMLNIQLVKETHLQGDENIEGNNIFNVVVFRKQGVLDKLFRIFIYIFLVFVTLAFGCKLDLAVVKENLRRPVAPAIGIACQYVLMPMIAFAIAKLVIPEDHAVGLGIFISGICPGGGVSNIYSHLLDGDLSLSITMTTISTIAAIGMMPLWIYTLGRVFTDGLDGQTKVSIPFFNIFTTLLILILPLLAGIFIKYKLPRVTKILMKVITPITVFTIAILISVGIYTNLFIFEFFEPKVILVGSMLPYCGYVLSGVICLILRQSWTKVKTIVIETGIQNQGIAILLMFTAFPPPDGEIAAVAPIASGVMTPLPLFVMTIIYLIYKRYNKDKYANIPKDDVTKRGDISMGVQNGNKTTLNGNVEEKKALQDEEI